MAEPIAPAYSGCEGRVSIYAPPQELNFVRFSAGGPRPWEMTERKRPRPQDKARQTVADHVTNSITSSDVSTYLRHG